MKYEYTADMREISGFGGGYEQCCREMVIAGVEWFDSHPDTNPQFHGFQGVYGLIVEDNEDAKTLSKAITEGRDCTGAMHQAAMSHIFFIHENGWEKYCEEMRRPKNEN